MYSTFLVLQAWGTLNPIIDTPAAADAVGIADPPGQPGTLELEQTVKVASPPVPNQGSREQSGIPDCARAEEVSHRHHRKKVTNRFIILLYISMEV
jgi:hypothetical protein